MSDAALVSIIVNTYNREHSVSRAIESALNQSYARCEVLVIDDGSSDNTCRIVEKYASTGVRYFFQENQGVPLARNAGIELATGDFLMFLDDDDELFPNAVAEGITALSCPTVHCGFAYSDVMVVDELGRERGLRADRKLPSGDIYREVVAGRVLCLNGAMLMRRECFDAVRYDPGLEAAEDVDFACRLTEQHEAVFVSSPFVKYTVYDTKGKSLASRKYSSKSSSIRYAKIFASPRFQAMPFVFRREIRSKFHIQMGRGYYAEGRYGIASLHLLMSILLAPSRRSSYLDCSKSLLRLLFR